MKRLRDTTRATWITENIYRNRKEKYMCDDMVKDSVIGIIGFRYLH